MNANDNLERGIADVYHAEAPHRAPDWVLANALETIESTPQRRVLIRVPWRFPDMNNTFAKVAIAAVVVLAIGVVGLNLLRPSASSGVGAQPPPAPQPQRAQAPRRVPRRRRHRRCRPSPRRCTGSRSTTRQDGSSIRRRSQRRNSGSTSILPTSTTCTTASTKAISSWPWLRNRLQARRQTRGSPTFSIASTVDAPVRVYRSSSRARTGSCAPAISLRRPTATVATSSGPTRAVTSRQRRRRRTTRPGSEACSPRCSSIRRTPSIRPPRPRRPSPPRLRTRQRLASRRPPPCHAPSLELHRVDDLLDLCHLVDGSRQPERLASSSHSAVGESDMAMPRFVTM